jgi:thiol-disulfide isomerase/thioredoxin
MRPSLLAAALLLAARPAAADEELAAGAPAPTFSLRTLNPQAAGADWISLDRFTGEAPEDPAAKAVLLSFFASWCEPCRRELPLLVQLDRTYRDQGLRVLAIDIDTDDAGIEAARKLTAAAKVAFPVLGDRFNLLARRYLGERAPLPSVFLVRRDGTVARVERGYGKDASTFLRGAVEDVLGIERPVEQAVANHPPRRASPSPGAGGEEQRKNSDRR